MNNENFNPGLAYSDYKQLQAVYVVAALTAYFLSCYFVVGYFAGNLHVLTWDASQWAQAIPSAGLVAVMTAYQFFLYSQGDVAGGKKATIIAVVVAVAFSLLSEIGQGMERDNIRMETKSQESPAFKAIVAAIGGSTGAAYNPYSADLQAAEMKLARCQERLAAGKERDCVQSTARVEAVNKMIAGSNQASQDRAVSLANQAKAMEKDERNYHPLVNAIREFFHVSGTIGSFLLSLTLISFFEYAFHYLGGRYAQAKAKLVQQGYDVTRKLRQPPRRHDGSITTFSEQDKQTPTPQCDKPHKEYLEWVTPENRDPDNKKPQGKPEYLLDSRWPTTPATPLQAMKAEFRGMVESAPAVIANEYARAQQSREQVYQKAADKLDGVQADLNRKAETKASQEAGKTYRQELREGEQAFSDSPLDQPRPTAGKTFEEFREKDGPELQQAVYEEFQDLRMPLPVMLKRIHADVLASGATSPEAIQAAVKTAYLNIHNPTPMNKTMLQTVARNISKQLDNTVSSQAAPTLPVDQQSGRTGLHNPVLGTAEEHYSLPLSNERAHSDNEQGYVHSTNERAHSVNRELLVALKDAQGKIDADVLKEGYGLYEQWKAEVLAGNTKLTTRDGRSFISAHLCRGKKRTITPDGMNALLEVWQVRAVKEGALTQNPKYTGKPPFPKYLLAA